MTDPYTPELRRTITGDAFQARAFVLRTGPIFVVPALRASIAIAGRSA